MERFNIYYRKDGRWEGRIPRGKDENGKRKFKYFFGNTKEQVHKMMMEFINKEIKKNDCGKTISAVFKEWYTSTQHKVKESTAANYFMKANKHILPEFGDKRIDSIIENDIYSFIETKIKQGLSNRYVSDIIILMKSVFNYAVKAYHVFNPLVGISLSKKRIQIAIATCNF